MLSRTNLKLNIIFFLFISLGLSACSKKEPVKPEVRAVERWNALIKKDWKTAYSFETPAFRKNYSFEQFKDRYGNMVTWKKIKFLRTEQINENLVKVTLDLTILFHPPGGGEMLMPGAIKERWLFSEDQWWYIAKNNSLQQ